jgi:C_GCAxxG_C_C family probable redox protein
MNEKTIALEAFASGHNCAQSVLLALSPLVGLEAETALKAASAFGGGMGRLGEACGAATGAFMALGYAHGPGSGKEAEKRNATYALVRDFAASFKKSNGSLSCRELTGLDLATDEGQAAFKERGLHAGLCSRCVGSAVEIALPMLGSAR